MTYSRFAIYFLPPPGALADFGAAWLGWDIQTGSSSDQIDIAGLPEITMAPRKYGFHGTLKPPFRLSEGTDLTELKAAVAGMAATCRPARIDGLTVAALGRFVALVPVGPTEELQRVAAACVTQLDGFRAEPTAQELERRRKADLSARQEALLSQWGYPYVLDEFRFHLTLTGPLDPADIDFWTAQATARLPRPDAPMPIDSVALCAERADGRFELIQRYALSG